MNLQEFREKMRRDWRDHRLAMIIQILSGLASGLLTAVYMKYQEPATVIFLMFLLVITWFCGRIKKGEMKNGNLGPV